MLTLFEVGDMREFLFLQKRIEDSAGIDIKNMSDEDWVKFNDTIAQMKKDKNILVDKRKLTDLVEHVHDYYKEKHCQEEERERGRKFLHDYLTGGVPSEIIKSDEHFVRRDHKYGLLTDMNRDDALNLNPIWRYRIVELINKGQAAERQRHYEFQAILSVLTEEQRANVHKEIRKNHLQVIDSYIFNQNYKRDKNYEHGHFDYENIETEF